MVRHQLITFSGWIFFCSRKCKDKYHQTPPASQEAERCSTRFNTKGHYGAALHAEFEAPNLSPWRLSDLLHIEPSNRKT
jgi:hypothetical protein